MIARVGERPTGIAIALPRDPERVVLGAGSVWVAADSEVGSGDQVLRYSHAGRLIGRREIGVSIGALAYGDGALWIGLRVYRKVLKLNLRTGVLTYWRTLPAPVYALHYHARALWATLRGQDTVVRMDVRGHGVVSGAAGHGPAQLVATGGRLFVASRNDHTVLVLDPRTLTPVQRPVHVGLNPFAVAAAGHSVWVTTIGDDSVTRIDYG